MTDTEGACWLSPNNLKDSKENSMALIIFACYMPNTVELLSMALKQVTPNMKKKKHANFDTFKTEIIKPCKSMVGEMKDHFKAVSTYYSDQSPIPLLQESQI